MKKSILKKVIAVGIMGVMALGLAGCGSSKKDTSNNSEDSKVTADAKDGGISLEEVKKKGKLVVGTSADYPPYEFHKEIDGKDTIVGFDIDIAKEIAKDMGVEVEIKDMDFDGLLVASQAGKVDLVIAGMNPTPEREENADFSDIYYKAENCFIVRKGDESKIKSEEDLKGLKIGVQKGSIQEGYAQDNFKDSEIKSLAKVTDLILDLNSNKIDAILVNTPVAETNCNKNDKLGMSEYSITDMQVGAAIAMKKNSTELKEAVNKSIKRLQDEGKIDEYVAAANELAEE